MSKKNRREPARKSAAKKKLEKRMKKVGMTPGSRLLHDDLARDLLESDDDKEIRRLVETAKTTGRRLVSKRARPKSKGSPWFFLASDLKPIKRVDDRRRARKKRIEERGDPQDQDALQLKELEKREKDAAGEPPRQKGKVKKMTHLERIRAIRKRLEKYDQDDGGKK
jgi:hypothetical protein